MKKYDRDKVSPTPYCIDAYPPDDEDPDYSYFIADADGTPVVLWLGRYPTDTHAHIVHCVNIHDQRSNCQGLDCRGIRRSSLSR